MNFAEKLSIAANLVTVSGVAVFIWQMREARIFASASSVAAICKNIVEQIRKLPQITDDPATARLWDLEYRNLLNELELACAIILDGSSAGRTGKIVNSLVLDILTAIVRDEKLIRAYRSASHGADTFSNIKNFAETNGIILIPAR